VVLLAAGCQDASCYCLRLQSRVQAGSGAGGWGGHCSPFRAFTCCCKNDMIVDFQAVFVMVHECSPISHAIIKLNCDLRQTELEPGQIKARMHGGLKSRTWRSALVTLRLLKRKVVIVLVQNGDAYKQ
jgi:hypothetical protein